MARLNNSYSFIAYNAVIFVSQSCTPPVRSPSSSLLPFHLFVLSDQLLNSGNVLLLRIRGAQVLDLSPLVVLGLAL
jgi:hypothetical protein